MRAHHATPQSKPRDHTCERTHTHATRHDTTQQNLGILHNSLHSSQHLLTRFGAPLGRIGGVGAGCLN
jgi:hypothetical protein